MPRQPKADPRGVEISNVRPGDIVSFPASEPGKVIEVRATEEGLYFKLINGCGGFYVPARMLWFQLDKLAGLE